MRTVLVLGGYGFFGQRISAALASAPSMRLLVGGRDLERARAACRAMRLSAENGVALDAHNPSFSDVLRRLQIDVIEADRDGRSPLGQFQRAVRVAPVPGADHEEREGPSKPALVAQPPSSATPAF